MRPPVTQPQNYSILHIISGDLWAGAEVMIYNLLSQLHQNPSIHITVLAFNEGILTQKLKELGIDTHIIPESSNLFPAIVFKAVKLLRSHSFDVIHGHRLKENILGLLLSLFIKPHCLIATIHGSPELTNLLKTRLIIAMNFVILRTFFSKTVVVAKNMMSFLLEQKKFRPSQIQFVHNGIDLSRFNPASTKITSLNSRCHIGTVGRMVPVKDFPLFISIASEIKKQVPNVHFSILGDGPLKDTLKKKVKELGMDEHIFEFREPETDPTAYYHSLDLYLNTSLHEGLPLSILEAMACGIPVVAPQVGGIPEIIVHDSCGYLVQGRDPELFARHCLKLIQDESLRLKFKEESLKRVSYFSSTRMAEEYLRLYNFNL
jgi:glycosyltransferase involved in cell wall biosynthesis